MQSLLDASAADWTLTAINAINNVGQIAGVGVHNGVTRAFLMTPVVP